MGSIIEINDTLQISTAQGFPADIFDLDAHRKEPITLDRVRGRVFEFSGKTRPRFFHLDPVRVYWYHNIGGRWLAWGHILVLEQGIKPNPNPPPREADDPPNVSRPEDWITWGKYRVSKIYDPTYQELFTSCDLPPELNYFADRR